MTYGEERWRAADLLVEPSSHRAAQGLRFFALIKMLEAAEIAARTGTHSEAVLHLRELQAYCERMIAILAPEGHRRPSLVDAA